MSSTNDKTDMISFCSPQGAGADAILDQDDKENKSPGQNPFDELSDELLQKSQTFTKKSSESTKTQNKTPKKTPEQNLCSKQTELPEISARPYSRQKLLEPISNKIIVASNSSFSNSPFKVPFSPGKPIKSPFSKKRSPLAFDLNCSFDIGRESLGILPNNAIENLADNLFNVSLGDSVDFGDLTTRESLGILNASARESLGFLNTSYTPRESLGILSTSMLNDLGRESIGIFDIRNKVKRRNSMENQGYGDGTVPEIVFSTTDDPSTSLGSLNAAFLLSHSRKLSVSSQNFSVYSANPSFNSQSLGEPSKIEFVSPKSNDYQLNSNLGITDIFNDALQGSEAFLDTCSTSYAPPVTKGIFSSNMGCIRNRIHSLPVTVEEKIGITNDKLAIIGDQTKNLESVIAEAKKIADNIAEDVSLTDGNNLSSNENNFLDATPQPDWPDDLNESRLNESVFEPVDKEIISKKVDKMFDSLPNVEQKIKIINQRTSGSSSSENSTNISRISRTSRGTNKTQNLSRISRNSEEVSKIISDLSQLIQDNEELSDSVKREGKNALYYVRNILYASNRSNESRGSNHDVDSGHSSVDDQQLEEQSPDVNKNGPSPNILKDNDETNNAAITKSFRRSVDSPTSSRIALIKTTNLSTASTNSQGSNDSRHSYRSGVIRNPLTAGSQRRVAPPSGSSRGPLKAMIPIESMTTKHVPVNSVTPPKRPSEGLRSKKTSTPIHEPKLKPMAASTPAIGRRAEDKLSTVSPLSRPKYLTRPSVKDTSLDLGNSKPTDIKPVVKKSLTKYSATVTRRNSSLSDEKLKVPTTFATRRNSVSDIKPVSTTNVISARQSTESKPTKTNTVVRRNSVSEGQYARGAVNKPIAKLERGLIRRNSVAEGNKQSFKTELEVSPHSKRRLSTGSKDTKIMSALNKVRQNILSSPYYGAKKDATVSQGVLSEKNKPSHRTLVTSKNVGKENLKL